MRSAQLHQNQSGADTAPLPPARAAKSEAIERDMAQYVADMILELRNMAKSVRLTKVMVPLEFAYYEAFSAANKVEIPPGEVERIKKLSQIAREFDGLEPDKDP